MTSKKSHFIQRTVWTSLIKFLYKCYTKTDRLSLYCAWRHLAVAEWHEGHWHFDVKTAKSAYLLTLRLCPRWSPRHQKPRDRERGKERVTLCMRAHMCDVTSSLLFLFVKKADHRRSKGTQLDKSVALVSLCIVFLQRYYVWCFLWCQPQHTQSRSENIFSCLGLHNRFTIALIELLNCASVLTGALKKITWPYSFITPLLLCPL